MFFYNMSMKVENRNRLFVDKRELQEQARNYSMTELGLLMCTFIRTTTQFQDNK